MKTGYFIVVAILLALLIASPFYFQLGNNQVKTIRGSKTYWMAMAENAWEYYQPGKGVNPQTGLHGAGLNYPYFTSWDLGTYIQALIDARELGLLQKDGPWGFDDRVAKILYFLKTRNLTSDGLPYLTYDSRTGQPYGDAPTFSIDEGKLYLALYNLKLLRPDLTQDIDYIVKTRNNNTALLPDPNSWLSATDFYCYYVASAFKAFGFEGWDNVPSSIINTIVSQPNVTAYGVELPTAHICNEPLLLTFFEVKPRDSKFMWLLSQVNLAQEARYNATGHYTAFSEGNTGLGDPTYVYEFIVDYDGSTFYTQGAITPIAYLKVAVGFDVIFNTPYTNALVDYILSVLPAPSNGYQEGVDESGRVVDVIIDRTNGIILSAARYAVDNSSFSTPLMQKSDLSNFPHVLIQSGVTNNSAIVIGDSNPHGPVGAAQTIDAIGGMMIMERLARQTPKSTLTSALDSWLIKFDSGTGNVTFLDSTTNMIVVGSPEVNALSYYYNSLRNQFAEPLVPVIFVIDSTGGFNYLYVPSSGSIYTTESDAQGNPVADYGVIMIFQDQFQHYIVMVYGLGANGTLGACQVLRDYDLWSLHGSAVIVKSYVDRLENHPSNSSIVEVVP
ncbi:DUF3131 domain-containing protein [Candidatus Bathyarchaeota archaeon A05DMB-2]|nr:DUF3131 domain-containing protein [Candidatus Bathyarchaeota archaeon A05DMB-2]